MIHTIVCMFLDIRNAHVSIFSSLEFCDTIINFFIFLNIPLYKRYLFNYSVRQIFRAYEKEVTSRSITELLFRERTYMLDDNVLYFCTA